ncbi:MAG: class I SAM-dependent methyltransferase [Porphyromonadaceae bacterium]|nr:class I SAM-dependent methyltransferase [Porphyromonadaceae bacterium]
MQERHLDREKYFSEQVYTTEKYVIPFIQTANKKPFNKDFHVFEIGCGEAGNLKPFLDLGCSCLGVDLAESKIELGKEFLSDHPNSSLLTLKAEDIYKFTDFSVKYDLIMLRDVIEHIHDQEKFIVFLQNFMHDKTIIFFGFPPWQNPFGGHQQVCKSKFLSVLPFFHLLPKSLYKGVLKMFGETRETIGGLLEIKETGISTERFERIIRNSNLKILRTTYFFINPNYEIKFGLKPREVFNFIAKVPIIRNFFITCGYYLIARKG